MSSVSFADQRLKLARVAVQGSELGEAIQGWKQRAVRVEPKIADDRLSWELRMRVTEPPPLNSSWNFTFDEAVHNLRSTLDNAVISIATGTGVGVNKQLQFPIAATRTEWKKEALRIRTLPALWQAAIEAIQPFQVGRPIGPGEGGLLILRDLDVEQKHYLQSHAVVESSQLEHDASVEFETEAGAAASARPEVEYFASGFNNGEVLARQRVFSRIAKVSGSFSIAAQVQVVHVDGRQFGATSILYELYLVVGRVLARLEGVNK
jgi:hypothetical protein